MAGTILVLNGASSAGKTSLLKALQQALAEPYLDAGLDKFIFMLPGRYLNRPLWDDVLGLAVTAGAHGQQLFSGMHQAQAALARAGNNLVCDHVLVEPAWVAECATLFADLPAYLIGVHCPLDVLVAREAARGDRTPGQAAAQHPLVHRHGVYDLTVDTSTHSAAECAAQIVAHLGSGAAPMAFRQLARP
jgi:chloramphenicol 3-O phosphotransferase